MFEKGVIQLAKEELAENQEAGKQIGKNLRQLRTSKGISIEALAKQIGVSKLTLLKIEQGEGNPTLSVIWKIANGLHIPITALLSFEADVAIARANKAMKLSSSDDEFIVEPLFRSQGLMECYRGYLQPQCRYESEAHRLGVVETVTVMAGQLTIEVEGESHHLSAYDSIHFKGDRPHAYINLGKETAVLHFLISYSLL
ncbi:helix-turn-helix domain-containing protein [Bacillus clausii]|nr:transcriptional regulator [Shouchella clausii]NMM69242.1 helix-turn-helix domain-containing protein [Shouchella clausii]NPC13133.1 helix-turn-helix domain-containing protein [Shouchella clausii]